MKENENQSLHLVFGGELENLNDLKLRDVSNIDIVGFFPDYQSAHTAWKSKAQSTVDNAMMRYFILDVLRILQAKELAS